MPRTINQNDLSKLRKVFTGKILLPEDPSYEDSRSIFNSMIERHPGLIARCTKEEDVVRAVNFGRDLDLEISIRGGGHSVAGWGLTEGGLMIDLSLMNAVEVDSDNQTARVGGGAAWIDFARACQPYNLATTGGTVPSVGVAGVTLGGGWGYLARKFGLVCDNLLSVKLITAEGKSINVSDKEHPELFWALHGGGGNFGVVTEFNFRLHSLPVTTLAYLIFSPDAGPDIAGRFRDIITDGPDEISGDLFYMTGPPEDFIPSYLVNQLCLGVLIFFAGPETDAIKIIRPLLEDGPAGQMIAEMPYSDILEIGAIEPGIRYFSSSEHFKTLPDEAVEKFCARANEMPVPSGCFQILTSWGGPKIRQSGNGPIADRDANWMVYPMGMWTDPGDDERIISWAKTLGSDLSPYATGSPYLNLIANEGIERMIAGYGGEANYRRLVKIKNEYDPNNLFHLNHNIKPS